MAQSLSWSTTFSDSCQIDALGNINAKTATDQKLFALHYSSVNSQLGQEGRFGHINLF